VNGGASGAMAANISLRRSASIALSLLKRVAEFQPFTVPKNRARHMNLVIRPTRLNVNIGPATGSGPTPHAGFADASVAL
jgi:hypothetical protein